MKNSLENSPRKDGEKQVLSLEDQEKIKMYIRDLI